MIERKKTGFPNPPGSSVSDISALVELPQPNMGITISLEVFIRDASKILEQREDIQTDDIKEVFSLVARFSTGESTMPTARDFLSSKGGDVTLARQTLEGILVSLVVQNMDRIGSTGLAWSMGHQLKQLEFLLGPTGQDSIIEALRIMPTAQRALLCEAMSTTRKTQLDYPDLFECSERQIARYILFTTYAKPRQENKIDVQEQAIVYGPTVEQTDKLSTLIEAALEREDDGSFSIEEVIENLVQDSKDPRTFRKLIRIAQVGGFLDDMVRFFEMSKHTSYYARLCFRLLQEGDFRDVVLDEDI